MNKKKIKNKIELEDGWFVTVVGDYCMLYRQSVDTEGRNIDYVVCRWSKVYGIEPFTRGMIVPLNIANKFMIVCQTI